MSDLAFNLVTDKFLSISSSPGVFYEGILKRALIRGNSGLDVVREYNGGRMNALDLAINGSSGQKSWSDRGSLVALLVKAGATMTGNSKAYQQCTTPFRWKRRKGDTDASSSRGDAGPWAASQADQRRAAKATGRITLDAGGPRDDSDIDSSDDDA